MSEQLGPQAGSDTLDIDLEIEDLEDRITFSVNPDGSGSCCNCGEGWW